MSSPGGFGSLLLMPLLGAILGLVIGFQMNPMIGFVLGFAGLFAGIWVGGQMYKSGNEEIGASAPSKNAGSLLGLERPAKGSEEDP